MSKKMHVIIVGNGSFAKAIAQQCKKNDVAYTFWRERLHVAHTVILYCGSDRLSKVVFEFCTKTKTPLILLSTTVTIPRRPQFPFLFVPNASVEVRAFIETVCTFAKSTPYKKVFILESHQGTKKDVSGTAKLIAEKIGEKTKIITSIRTLKEQRGLHIPEKYLTAHAYHKVTFEHDGLSTSFSVLVLGRETYAKGALEIARSII